MKANHAIDPNRPQSSRFRLASHGESDYCDRVGITEAVGHRGRSTKEATLNGTI